MNAALNGGVAIKESKKPKYSRFTQQELPACKPLLTPAWVIGTLFVIGAVFIPIGAVSLAASNSVVEVAKRYDDLCLPNLSNQERDARIRDYTGFPDKQCTLTLQITKEMKPPIYLYYQINNFYQNHRRYVKSRNDAQLRGDNVTGSALDVCKPQAHVNGDSSQPAILPCGLIAWSLFNDSYALSVGASGLALNEQGIAWSSDVNVKFGSELPQNFNNNATSRGGGTLDPNTPLDQDQHLIVWMRTAALPTFRKLYGSMNTSLAAGTVVSVSIANMYNTYAFGGQKWVVLSTASWLGGRNSFLGVAYLVIGGLCVVLALAFLVLHVTKPRPLGDVSYLSWNRNAESDLTQPINSNNGNRQHQETDGSSEPLQTQ